MADKQTIEYLKEASRLRNAAKVELERITKELMSQKGISEATARIEARKEKAYKDIADQLKEVTSQVKELRDAQKEVVGSLMLEEQKLKSLTGIQQSIAGIERKKLDLFAKQNSMHENQKDAFGRISDLNRELLELSAEDKISRAEISRQIEQELEQLREKGKRQDGLGKGSRELLALMEEEYSIATRVSNMTEGQQKALEAQLEVYDSMKKTIGGILDTASLLTSGPAGIMGMSLIGAGMFAGKLGEVRSELGGISEFGTTALSFIDENAVENAKELATQFGGINNVSAELQASTSAISATMGISGIEAAGLLGSFSRLSDGSTETALNLAKSTQEFAKQNGIIPSQLMSDLAGSAEEFALFGKEGGKNLIEAGAAARKMGVSLKTMTGIADNLLDFESSITKELELGAMLGKNINLDRARSLAYEGDLAGATKETLNALGGIDAFNKMDYFQKKATADLLGVSVDELQKMAANQEQAATIGGQLNEKFSLMGQTLDAGLNKYLGTSLEAIGGMVIAGGQMTPLLKDMGINMGGMVKNTGIVLKNLLGMVAGPVINGLKSVGSFISGSSVGGAVGGKIGNLKDRLLQGTTMTSPITDGGGGGKVGKAGDFGKGVEKNLKGISKGLAAVANPKALLGLAAITASIIGIGYALKIAAPGIVAIGEAIGSVVRSVGDAVSTIIGGLGDFFMKITSIATPEMALAVMGLAGSFVALSASLATFAVAGVAAIPAMTAVGLFAATGGASLLGIGGEGGAEATDRTGELIDEIKGLRSDLNSGKIAVYVDGRKVTSSVSRVVDKVSTNSYGL